MADAFPAGDSGGGLPIGLLKAKTALVFNTSHTSAEREKTVFGDSLERIWKDCLFDFCGIKRVDRLMFTIVADGTSGERETWLVPVRSMIDRYFP